jgi:hypothetical protein
MPQELATRQGRHWKQIKSILDNEFDCLTHGISQIIVFIMTQAYAMQETRYSIRIPYSCLRGQKFLPFLPPPFLYRKCFRRLLRLLRNSYAITLYITPLPIPKPSFVIQIQPLSLNSNFYISQEPLEWPWYTCLSLCPMWRCDMRRGTYQLGENPTLAQFWGRDRWSLVLWDMPDEENELTKSAKPSVHKTRVRGDENLWSATTIIGPLDASVLLPILSNNTQLLLNKGRMASHVGGKSEGAFLAQRTLNFTVIFILQFLSAHISMVRTASMTRQSRHQRHWEAFITILRFHCRPDRLYTP